MTELDDEVFAAKPLFYASSIATGEQKSGRNGAYRMCGGTAWCDSVYFRKRRQTSFCLRAWRRWDIGRCWGWRGRGCEGGIIDLLQCFLDLVHGMFEIVSQLDYATPSGANRVYVQVGARKAFGIDERSCHVAVVCSEYGELEIDLCLDSIFDMNQRARMLSWILCGRQHENGRQQTIGCPTRQLVNYITSTTRTTPNWRLQRYKGYKTIYSSVNRDDFAINDLCRIEDPDRFFCGLDTTRHHCPKGWPHAVRAIMLRQFHTCRSRCHRTVQTL